MTTHGERLHAYQVLVGIRLDGNRQPHPVCRYDGAQDREWLKPRLAVAYWQYRALQREDGIDA